MVWCCLSAFSYQLPAVIIIRTVFKIYYWPTFTLSLVMNCTIMLHCPISWTPVIVQTVPYIPTLCFCLPGRVKRILARQQGEIHSAAPLKGQWFMRLALLSLGLGGIAGIIFCKWVWKCSWPGWPGHWFIAEDALNGEAPFWSIGMSPHCHCMHKQAHAHKPTCILTPPYFRAHNLCICGYVYRAEKKREN